MLYKAVLGVYNTVVQQPDNLTALKNNNNVNLGH